MISPQCAALLMFYAPLQKSLIPPRRKTFRPGFNHFDGTNKVGFSYLLNGLESRNPFSKLTRNMFRKGRGGLILRQVSSAIPNP